MGSEYLNRFECADFIMKIESRLKNRLKVLSMKLGKAVILIIKIGAQY